MKLEQRTSDLKEVIIRMNTSIQRFNDIAEEAGLGVSNVKLALQLQETVRNISQMAENASANCDYFVKHKNASKDDSDEAVHSQFEESTATRSLGVLAFDGELLGPSTDETTTGELTQRNFPSVPSHEMLHESTEQWEGTLTSSENLQLYHKRQASFFDMLIRPTLTSPTVVDTFSYSFLETSFARRLHRQTLETGYSDSLVRPERFRRIFAIPLLYLGGDAVRERLKFRLVKGLDEPVDGVFSPFRYLGGAGKHYPERGDYTRILKGPSGFVCSLDGLQNMADGGDHMNPEAYLSIKGYEGEWFDPTDVEGYLEEKGFHIDPQSMFAEGEMIEDSLPWDSNESANSERISASPDAYTTDMIMNDAAFQPSASILDTTPLSGGHYIMPQDLCWDIDREIESGFNDSQTDFQYSAVAIRKPTIQPQKRIRKRVTIDVSRLLDGGCSIQFSDMPNETSH